MGAVYRAVHSTLERPVAIKLLPPEMAGSPEHVARFLREARVVSALQHPNVVLVYDAGEEEGRYYIAMELIEGQSLDRYLVDKERLGEDEALELLAQCLQGLAAAHAKGLVHRDIKPENLLLDREHRIHIADFGLVMESASTTCLTLSGVMMGTPQYISPEQADGAKADQRTDLYSLGVTFYYALTGQLPFQAPSAMSLLFKHKYERPIPPKEIRPRLSESTDRLLLWLMGKRLEDRPPNAEAVLQMIEAIHRGDGIPVPPKAKLPVLPDSMVAGE
jgi:serine/threonine-protein kinase